MRDHQQETISRIKSLCRDHNAIILAHNYQPDIIQDLADFVGDSLELSVKAAALEEKTIVFCGVRFMAETAKILSPDKTVLLPNANAGCPMADMADAESLRRLKAMHPGAVTVCYVNSTAEVKTECDICCTSANAENIVKMIPPEREIIFLPDKNLGANVEKATGRKMILWPGFCPTHMRIVPEIIIQRKKEYPEAVLMVHPECVPAITAMADEVLSTGGMLRFARETAAKQIIVGTEIGLLHRLRRENPHKEFIPVSANAICANMKMISLHDVLNALENNETQINVPEEIRVKAKKPIIRMIEGKIDL